METKFEDLKPLRIISEPSFKHGWIAVLHMTKYNVHYKLVDKVF